MFTTSTGKPISPRNVLRHFHNSLAKAGIPRVKFHSLRHTFISYLLSKNVPPKDVQVIAGHSSFAVNRDTYGYTIKGAQKEAAKKLEGVFKI
jgi:integrase